VEEALLPQLGAAVVSAASFIWPGRIPSTTCLPA
jgi:hypothetical protein